MKVDITKKVLDKIQSDKIQIKPRWQFVLARVALISFVSVLAFYLFLVTGGLAFISKNQIFFDYLSLGAKGIMSFFASLPWLALIMFMGIATLIVIMIKNFEFIYKHRYVPMALMLVFLVFGGVAFGMSGKGSDSIQAKIADAIRFNEAKPTQVSGKVYQVDEKALIIVNDKNNKISINISSSTYYKNGNPEVGDKILVIGKMTDNKIDADIVKIIKKADKQAEQKGEVKSEKTENKAQEDQPKTESTNNEQPKNNSSSPAPAPSPSPTPTPIPTPVPTKSITITTPSGTTTSTKYSVTWTANYSAEAFKLVWSETPNPVYPPNLNNQWVAGGTGGSAKVILKDSAPVKYYVRVCEYSGGGCSNYSNPIEVTFLP